MKKISLTLAAALVLLSSTNLLWASDPDAPLITANKLTTTPVIDGDMDAIWEALPWYSLNYVWMDWNTTVDSSDYYGHFKIGWSEETDLLYFFIEITDDVLIERYSEMGNTPYYNDIVEVFLDEDGSGGMHIFDGTTNAENAFSYHITPLAAPTADVPVTDFMVADTDGTSWGSSTSPDYIDHFPEMIMVKKGDQYYWEFSLTVYNDSYEQSAPDGTDVPLELNKELGIALAYCEADDPAVYKREMFLGSMPGNASKLGSADNGALYGYNDTWQNADDYSMLKLGDVVGSIPDGLELTEALDLQDLEITGRPHSGQIHLQYSSSYTGDVQLEMYDLTGRKVYFTSLEKRTEKLNYTFQSGQSSGIYFARIKQGHQSIARKIILQ